MQIAAKSAIVHSYAHTSISIGSCTEGSQREAGLSWAPVSSQQTPVVCIVVLRHCPPSAAFQREGRNHVLTGRRKPPGTFVPFYTTSSQERDPGMT